MFIPSNFDKMSTSGYMKFSDGENKIRILEEPITGYVYWEDAMGNVVPRNEMAGKGGKPVRAKDYDNFTNPQRSGMKGFAAMIVWNYQVNKVQILEVKQTGIMASLEALSMSKSWLDVTSFDIVVTRTKTGADPKDVEYSVMPEPKEKISEEIENAYKELNINLQALYKGEDPFGEKVEVNESELKEFTEDLDAQNTKKKTRR